MIAYFIISTVIAPMFLVVTDAVWVPEFRV